LEPTNAISADTNVALGLGRADLEVRDTALETEKKR
jgi:hypothetical protein